MLLLQIIEYWMGGLLGVYLILSTLLVTGIALRDHCERSITLEDLKHYFWIWCFGILFYIIQAVWRGLVVAWKAASPVRLSRNFRRVTVLEQMTHYDELGRLIPVEVEHVQKLEHDRSARR